MNIAAEKLHWKLQTKVIDRAFIEIPNLRHEVPRFSLMMDLDSVKDLDLGLLLEAPKFDFAHDICGIIRHMDRSTYPGKLKDCFVPRCCRS